MSDNSSNDFEIPSSFIGKKVSASYNIVLPSKSAMGGVGVNFPGVDGVLVEVLRGSIVMMTTDPTGKSGLICVPKSTLIGLSCAEAAKPSLIS